MREYYARAVMAICASFAPAAIGGCTDARALYVEEQPSPCFDCHGSRTNADPAPPPAVWREEPSGSHRAHLDPSDWHAPVECGSCHRVPTQVFDPGHVDTPLPAELTFGEPARAGGATPSYDGASCSGVYCHGATLEIGGGSEPSPVWGTSRPQDSCDWCHGAPPPPPHRQVDPSSCGPCHNFTGRVPNDPSTHINGVLDFSPDIPCNACHGSDGDPNDPLNRAPPADTGGGTDTTRRGVGAHQEHLQASDWHAPIPCDTCHTVPATASDPGHADTPRPAELNFSATAIAGGATPSFDGTSCSGVYCHGATLTIGGGATIEPVWTQVDGTQKSCDSCHGAPPPPPHRQVDPSSCSQCHNFTGRVPNDPSTHINGVLDFSPDIPCNACHGSDGDPNDPLNRAPPADTGGGTDTTRRGVGAHQEHLQPSDWHAPIPCDTCHTVPTAVSDPGHADTPRPAELNFSATAIADEATPSFDGTSCSGVYCHGATLTIGGGATNEPVWTQVDGTQKNCDSCHGAPPPPPHLQVDPSSCAPCHNFTGRVPDDPSTHINGVLDLSANVPCNACHGSAGDPDDPLNRAPPVDTSGGTETTRRGVGSHQEHLQPSTWHAQIPCATCHTVPAVWTEAGHADTPRPAELNFSATAIADGAVPSFDGTSCSGVYCHGVTLTIGGGATNEPVWTKVDGTQKSCDSCHGAPPPLPHLQVDPSGCDPCHYFTGRVPDDPSTHINGTVDYKFYCGGCHDVAPTTGAHPTHYGESTRPPRAVYGDLSVTADYEPDGLPIYLYGCGNCHPTDGSRHMNGTVDVELYDETAPASSLKSNQPPTASYNGSTCTDVYCHSSGQATPTYVETPDWHSGTLPEPRCSGCHTNPPSYPSGGAGSATANSHVVLAEDGYEYGHFGGLPGAWHSGGGYHGRSADQGSPISCQTCHYDSINPNDTGPGGFYWLNTDGNYDLGGSLGYRCDNCHSDTNPDAPLGSGRAWSKAHVNGHRDVVFDPRTSIPSGTSGLPAPPNTPTLPYWVTAQPTAPPPDSVLNGTATWSLHVAGASFDSATKTCSNVPCHLNQSFGTGAPEYDPLVWGTVPVGWVTCNACHQN